MKRSHWLGVSIALIALIALAALVHRSVSSSSRGGVQRTGQEAGRTAVDLVEGAAPGASSEEARTSVAARVTQEVTASAGERAEPAASEDVTSGAALPPARLWIEEFEPLANDLIAGTMTSEQIAELLGELAAAIEGLEPELLEDESRAYEIEQEGYGKVVVTLPPYGPGVGVAVTSVQPTTGWDHDDSPGCTLDLEFDVTPSGVLSYQASAQTFLKHAATARYMGGDPRQAGAVLDVRAGESTWKPILVTMVDHQGRSAQKMSIGEAVTASFDPGGEGMRSIRAQLARIRGER